MHKSKNLMKNEFRRKNININLIILRRRILDEEFLFVEYSLSIRRVFVDKFFAMCRWALSAKCTRVADYYCRKFNCTVTCRNSIMETLKKSASLLHIFTIFAHFFDFLHADGSISTTSFFCNLIADSACNQKLHFL